MNRDEICICGSIEVERLTNENVVQRAEIARLRRLIVDWWRDPDNPPPGAARVYSEYEQALKGDGS